MKKIGLLITATLLTACSTFSPNPEELKQANKCKVWKQGLIGNTEVVEVEGETAQQKMTCWVMGLFVCTYTDYTFNGKTNEIRSSLPPADKTIATLDGDRMTVSMTGITVPPFQLGNGRADYLLTGFGPQQRKSVEFNSSCSKRQAALGLLTMIAK